MSTDTQVSTSTQAITPPRKSNALRIAGVVLAALALIAAGVLIGWLVTSRTVPATGYPAAGWMMPSAAPVQVSPQVQAPVQINPQASAPAQVNPQAPAYGRGMMGGWNGGPGNYGRGGMMGGWNGGPGGYGGGMMGGKGYGYGPGMMGGWGEGYGPMAEYHDLMIATLAEQLGMTAEELQAEFDAGKTIWQIGEEQGLSDEELLEVMNVAREAMVAQALEDGAITQEQADWMLSHDIGQCPGWGGWNDDTDE